MAGAIVAAIIFDLDQHGDDGKKQQDMNKITHRIATYQPQQPQNYQYQSNRPQNVILLSDDRIRLSSSINLLHPRQVGNCVEHPFIGLFEKVHCPLEHPEMVRLQVGYKVLTGIPFLKKKESVFILDTSGEVAAPASFLHTYGTG